MEPHIKPCNCKTCVNKFAGWKEQFYQQFVLNHLKDGLIFGWSKQDMDGYEQVVKFIEELLDSSNQKSMIEKRE